MFQYRTNSSHSCLTLHTTRAFKFGICHLIILDDCNPFKGFFTATRKALHINYDILTKRNHKGVLLRSSNRLINKALTIVAEDKDTDDVLVAAGTAVGYAYNSSPIDCTGILPSVPVIGWELCFPLDIDLSALPPIISNNNESVVYFLHLIDCNR